FSPPALLPHYIRRRSNSRSRSSLSLSRLAASAAACRLLSSCLRCASLLSQSSCAALSSVPEQTPQQSMMETRRGGVGGGPGPEWGREMGWVRFAQRELRKE
ncbi:MAG: hypothetical protein Q9228_004975, partial [Teloschistes exilis]